MGDNFIAGVVAAASANLCVYDSIPDTSSNTWIIDTVAFGYMTYDAKFFDELSSNTLDPYITSVNGLSSPIIDEGTISLTPTLSLSCALLVPNIHCNLLSVGRLLDTLNVSATFYSTHCSFQDLKTHETIGHGKQIEGLYYLTLPSTLDCDRVVNIVQSCNVKDKHQIWLWHHRLGHPSKHMFSYLLRYCDESSFKCETCILAKSYRIVFPLSDSKATKPFDLVHSDVWGLARITLNEFRWSKYFGLIAEGHDVLSAAYLINCTPSRVIDFKSPHDVFGDYVFPISVFKFPPKVFGCVAYVYDYSHQRSKLDSCALRCVFIGYSSNQKSYKCYHPPTQKVHVTLDVTFHKEVPYYISQFSPIQGERMSELESLGLENLGLELENDVFKDTALGK
ncbi:unnamed protein product [Prunus armeniaca]